MLVSDLDLPSNSDLNKFKKTLQSGFSIDLAFTYVLINCDKSKHKQEKIKIILVWIKDLLVNNEKQKSLIKHHYFFYFSLLKYVDLQRHILQLIYLTTDYNNLTEWVVKNILSLNERNNKNMIKSILTLFKSMKPNLVPQDETINPQRENNIIALKKPYSNNIQYISEFGSIENIVRQLIKPDVEIAETETDIESLVNNRFSFLYMTINAYPIIIDNNLRVFFYEKRNDWLFSEESNLKLFLINVYRIETLLQQELVCKSDFLFKYISIWNGDFYRQEILKLVENCIILDYYKFFDKIITPLYKLCLSKSDPEFIRNILKTFSRLIYNNYKSLSRRKNLFLPSRRRYGNKTIIFKLKKVMDHFCKLFINMFPDNHLVLHSVIDFYVLISIAESHTQVVNLITIPRCIIHKILIQSDAIAINKLSQFFISSIELATKRGLTNKDTDVKELGMQMNDLLFILFYDITNSTILNRFKMEEKESIPNVDKYLRLHNNLAFLPICWLNENNELIYSADKRLVKQRLGKILPKFIEFKNLIDNL